MIDQDLTQYCNAIAEDIARDAKDYEQACDWAHESADGSEYAIYYHKAHTVCQNCNVENGEQFFEDCYSVGDVKTYDEIACIMAYGEIRARIESRLFEIFEARGEV